MNQVTSPDPESANVSATKLSTDHLEIHKLAFGQGLKNLADQESTLGTLRQRAGALVSISGLAAAVLGKAALTSGLSIPSWIAIASLAVNVIACGQLIRPRAGWIFYFKPSEVIDQFAHGEHATSLSRTYEVLARFSEEGHESNNIQLKELFMWLWVAIVSVLAQLIFWLLAI